MWALYQLTLLAARKKEELQKGASGTLFRQTGWGSKKETGLTDGGIALAGKKRKGERAGKRGVRYEEPKGARAGGSFLDTLLIGRRATLKKRKRKQRDDRKLEPRVSCGLGVPGNAWHESFTQLTPDTARKGEKGDSGDTTRARVRTGRDKRFQLKSSYRVKKQNENGGQQNRTRVLGNSCFNCGK